MKDVVYEHRNSERAYNHNIQTVIFTAIHAYIYIYIYIYTCIYKYVCLYECGVDKKGNDKIQGTTVLQTNTKKT